MSKKSFKRNVYDNYDNPEMIDEEDEVIEENLDPSETTEATTTQGNQKEIKTEKKKSGRPKKKKEPDQLISLAIPKSVYAKAMIAKGLHGSFTAYIINLIVRDFDSNYELYKNMMSSSNNIIQEQNTKEC